MDATLRVIEREAAQGDPAAQARLLNERLRAGDLLQEDLELAASLGHHAARLIVTDVDQIGEVSRGWQGMRRFLGVLAQRRPMAVGEWLAWVAKNCSNRLPSPLRLAILVLETWLRDANRRERATPDLLLRTSPDRGTFLGMILLRHKSPGTVFRLSENGRALVVAQRQHLAELILRRNEEEPLSARRRRPRRSDSVVVAFDDPLSSEEKGALDICGLCSVAGGRRSDRASAVLMYRHHGVSMCEPCFRSATRGDWS